jgi:hypothetical protein
MKLVDFAYNSKVTVGRGKNQSIVFIDTGGKKKKKSHSHDGLFFLAGRNSPTSPFHDPAHGTIKALPKLSGWLAGQVEVDSTLKSANQTVHG